MVRGKCVFLSVNDIIDTIADIQKFVEKKGKDMRIIEIENRFKCDIPISDVTLKIAIKE